MTSRLEAVDWPVKTARLTIRPAGPDDLDAVWQIRRLPQVADGVSSAPQTREEYAEPFLDPE